MREVDEKEEEDSGGGDDEDPLVRKRMGAGVGVTAIGSRMTHDGMSLFVWLAERHHLAAGGAGGAAKEGGEGRGQRGARHKDAREGAEVLQEPTGAGLPEEALQCQVNQTEPEQ